MDRQRLMEYKDAKHFVLGFNCETERQKEVFTNFYYAACALIGGEENALSDYCEDERSTSTHSKSSATTKAWCLRFSAGALLGSTDAGLKVRCSPTRSTTTSSATTSCVDAPKLL